MRFGWIVVACVLWLTAAVHAAPQQPSPSQAQPPDQGGPPTLRHNDPGSQPEKSTGTQSGPTSSAQDATQPVAAPENVSSPPTPPTAPPASAPGLSEEAKLQLLRSVDGEYVKVLMPLPGGRDGYHLKAGAPLDQDSLRRALTFGGAALNVGDSVQITKLEFHERDIQFELNNGAKGKSSWRDHIQIVGSGGLPVSSRTTTTPENGPAVVPQKTGATIYLDFDRSVPDMTGEQLKAYLVRVLDFSKRSAAVQYADSLPPQMRQAIAERRAEVGMDRDMVTAAMGRPERKIRERDEEGNDTEDWIYGTPPEKTIFVTFEGDKVVRVTEYR